MKSKKKIFRAEEKVTIDSNTGQIMEEVTVKSSYVPAEPNFVKMYIDDIAKLNNVPKSSSDVLNILVKNMSYGNIVIMIKPIKDIIASELDMSENTINKSIDRLYKSGILIRKSRGVYLVDPTLFAKGKWEDISKLRMVIEYNSDGTKTIKSDMMEQLKIGV